jgi:hypothetical protein
LRETRGFGDRVRVPRKVERRSFLEPPRFHPDESHPGSEVPDGLKS